jgi:hypothetical protein
MKQADNCDYRIRNFVVCRGDLYNNMMIIIFWEMIIIIVTAVETSNLTYTTIFLWQRNLGGEDGHGILICMEKNMK